jgi:hypothetical protein
MKRLSAVLVLSALLTALLPSVGHAAPYAVRRLQAAGVGDVKVPLRCKGAATQIHAFTIKAEWNKRVFTNTEKALVTITVTRPAPYDPLGLGIPIPELAPVPAEGVTVWTSVLTGRYPFPYGYGVTDADGQVNYAIPLKLLSKPGPYDVSHYASKWTNQNACPDIEEWGYLKESPGLTIKP